jgi:hypothetical protein
VSILSGNGVTVEVIADLVGHKTTIVTQKVYLTPAQAGDHHGRDNHEHDLQPGALV